MRKLLLVFALLFVSATAQARTATYYTDTSPATGVFFNRPGFLPMPSFFEATTGLMVNNLSKFLWENGTIAALGEVTSGDIIITTLPPKTIVHAVYFVVNTHCTVADTLTMSIGRTPGSYNDYVVAGSLMAADNTCYGCTEPTERGTKMTGFDFPSPSDYVDLVAHLTISGADITFASILNAQCDGKIYVLTSTLP
jgi:hypothetical protein